MKFCPHERDNISGKQNEYAILMLVILAENAFHVVGFNLFNSIFVVGFGVCLDCADIILTVFWCRQLCATLSLCTMFQTLYISFTVKIMPPY